MKFALTVFILAFVGCFDPAFAGKEYTPAQLREMIAKKQYPKQGRAQVTKKTMTFAACVLAVDQMMSAISSNYPVSTIVRTSILRTDKAWTNDGAVTATCSEPDNSLVLTQAKYL